MEVSGHASPGGFSSHVLLILHVHSGCRSCLLVSFQVFCSSCTHWVEISNVCFSRLLYVRESGGWERWYAERKEEVKELWKNHGGKIRETFGRYQARDAFVREVGKVFFSGRCQEHPDLSERREAVS